MLSFWLLVCFLPAIAATASPYQIYNYTWVIINQASDVANASTYIGPQPSYSPLIVDLCALAMGADPLWGTPSHFMPQPRPVNTSTWHDPPRTHELRSPAGQGSI
ncbi:envelope glycoprotein [Cricetulus griseus]|nr:envelope glycoprotein [Cricetulus griseus]